MSDIPASARLDLDEQLARIERSITEAAKLREEATKLRAEGRKFDRELWLIPLSALIALFAAIAARLPEILAAFGVKP